MALSTSIKDISVEDYSERAFVVRGETKEHKDTLTSLGGKWNSRLRDGPGWIFSKRCRDNVDNWVKSGTVVKPSFQKRVQYGTTSSQFLLNKGVPLTTILDKVTTLEKRIASFDSKINKLTKLLTQVAGAVGVLGSDLEDTEEDTEEDFDEQGNKIDIPRKRLLR